MKRNQFGEIIKNEPLKKHCSMHVGGGCKLFCMPQKISQLLAILKYSNKNKIKYFILGNGTNVIFKDNGYNGIIICLNKFQQIKQTKNGVCVDAGVGLFKLNTYLAQNGLAGLEWSYGIPGTVGGAVCMNAGAYGSEVCNFVEKVEVIENYKKKIIKCKNLQFFYRDSTILQKKLIVTKVWLKLKKDSSEKIIKNQKQFFEKRKITQPIEFYNSGSIFKKVDGESAGKIIDNLGLKNVKINGAEVSGLHANFIINKGNATAQDVVDLIQKIKKQVVEKTGKVLEQEVIIVGD